MKRLQDRVAVVTGAGSGIGRATALALAREGCHLALCDVDETGLEETRGLVAGGRRTTQHVVDVADWNRMQRFAEEVRDAHGGADVLVNNAGVSVAARFVDHSLEDFQWLFGINFWGVVHGCKLFLPQLLEGDEGHIVNVSSIFGVVGMPMNSSYCASKFAVRGLSESLRAELVGSGVGVTSVHPGGVATRIVDAARFVEPEDMRGVHERARQAFKKMLPPEKAADAIVRGIRRNAPRVLITKEAHALDAVKRAFPALTGELVGRHWHRVVKRLRD